MDRAGARHTPREVTPVERRNLAAVSDVLPYWNSGDIPGVLNFYDERIVWTNVALEEAYRGYEGVGGYLKRLMTAYPDLRFEVSHKFPRGTRVAERWVIQGTHLGPYLGIPPTGRPTAIHGMSIVNLPEGKFVSDRFYFDTSSVLRDMALMPSGRAFRLPPLRVMLAALGAVASQLPMLGGPTPIDVAPVPDDDELSDRERANLRALRYMVSAFNDRRIDRVKDVVSERVRIDNKTYGEPQAALPAMLESLDALATAFPDAEVTILQTLARDDDVACELMLTGRHEGAFLGISPTGKEVRMPAIAHLEFEDGVIHNIALYADSGMLWRQFGLMPPLAFLNTSVARVSLWLAVNRVKVIGLVVLAAITMMLTRRRARR